MFGGGARTHQRDQLPHVRLKVLELVAKCVLKAVNQNLVVEHAEVEERHVELRHSSGRDLDLTVYLGAQLGERSHRGDEALNRLQLLAHVRQLLASGRRQLAPFAALGLQAPAKDAP